MKNKKVTIPMIIVMVIVLGLYSLCVFTITDNRTATFWTVYLFTALAIIAEFTVPILVSLSANVKKSAVLGLSPIVFTTGYFFLQLIVGSILLLVHAGTTLTVVINVVVFGVFMIRMLILFMGTSYVADTETKIAASTASIQAVTAKAEAIYTTQKDEAKKETLKKLYEALRYTDPVSNTDDIRALDSSIKARVLQIGEHAVTMSAEELDSSVQRVLDMIQERSILCKSSK